jgi:hypothetical protein
MNEAGCSSARSSTDLKPGVVSAPASHFSREVAAAAEPPPHGRTCEPHVRAPKQASFRDGRQQYRHGENRPRNYRRRRLYLSTEVMPVSARSLPSVAAEPSPPRVTTAGEKVLHHRLGSFRVLAARTECDAQGANAEMDWIVVDRHILRNAGAGRSQLGSHDAQIGDPSHMDMIHPARQNPLRSLYSPGIPPKSSCAKIRSPVSVM